MKPNISKWSSSVSHYRALGILLMLFSAFAACAIYIPSLTYPPSFLDYHELQDNWHFIYADPAKFFERNPFEIIAFISIKLGANIDFTNVSGNRITNLLLHLLNGFLVFLFSKNLVYATQRSERTEGGFSPECTGAIAAAFFLLHPIQIQSVLLISNRTGLITSFLWLCIMNYYLRFRMHSQIYLLATSCFLFLIAAFASPTSIQIALFLVILEYFLPRNSSKWTLAPSALLFMTLASYVAIIASFYPETYTNEFLKWVNFLTEHHLPQLGKTVTTYVSLLILPLGFSPIHPTTSTLGFLEISATACMLVAIGLCLMRPKTNTATKLGIVSYFVFIMINTSHWQSGHNILEHRNYFAASGLFIALAYTIWQMPEHSVFARFLKISVPIVFICILTGLSLFRIEKWSKPNILWQAAANQYNDDEYVLYYLSEAYYRIGDNIASLNAANRSLRLQETPGGRVARFRARIELNLLADAGEDLKFLTALPQPQSSFFAGKLAYWSGEYYKRSSQCKKALPHFFKADKLLVESAIIHLRQRNLKAAALCYIDLGDYVKASLTLKSLSAWYYLDPSIPFLQGRIAYEIDRLEEAVYFFNKTYNSGSYSADLFKYMHLTYKKLGKIPLARNAIALGKHHYPEDQDINKLYESMRELSPLQ